MSNEISEFFRKNSGILNYEKILGAEFQNRSNINYITRGQQRSQTF